MEEKQLASYWRYEEHPFIIQSSACGSIQQYECFRLIISMLRFLSKKKISVLRFICHHEKKTLKNSHKISSSCSIAFHKIGKELPVKMVNTIKNILS